MKPPTDQQRPTLGRSALSLLAILLVGPGCSDATSNHDAAGGGQGGQGEDGGSSPCATSSDCAVDEFCEETGYACGDDAFPRVCVERPTSCEGVVPEPVCGCDGQVYESLCAAAVEGVSAALYSNACEPPPGSVRCGWTFCASDREICVETLEVSFRCEPLPEGCDLASPSCETCNPTECSCSDSGGISIVC